MAGYDGYSMSNNARRAYYNGLVPASKVPGVPSALVSQFGRVAEWHHTSSKFNRTNFYNPTDVRIVFGLEPESDESEAAFNPMAAEALKNHKAAQAAVPEILENCTVNWIEWQGSFRRPKAVEHTADGCRVEIKGAFALITLPSGETFKKKVGANGFNFHQLPR